MVTRPVRERTIDNIETPMERTLAATGYEEVCWFLCHLWIILRSHDGAKDERKGKRANGWGVAALTAIRLLLVELADIVAGVRRTGLTFAPEAASPRLRSVINKWIPDEELLSMSQQAYQLGWDHVKLYFMIDLPTERDDDVDAIADLTLKTLDVTEDQPKSEGQHWCFDLRSQTVYTVSMGSQIDRAETKRRQEILFAKIGKHPTIKFGRHNANETFLEGLVSRSDRRAGDLIQRAL